MKRTITSLFAMLCLVFAMTGCSGNANTYKSYTYTVDTGDSVKISLRTSDGYDMTSELPFTISCEEQTLTQGTFILAEDYEGYVSSVNSDENAELIDSGTQGGNEYIFWSYGDSEYNYAILIKDSNTGVILGNTVSEESAKECFSRLEITIQ